jgi:hypothetical protein
MAAVHELAANTLVLGPVLWALTEEAQDIP